MYVVMVTSEFAPAAKAGGLGDVVSGLSRELEIRGNAVEIILPKYDGLRHADIWGLEPSYHDLWVPWYGGTVRCTVWFGYAKGHKCFFIEPHSAASFFGRDRLYGYEDDPARFAFFSKAALEGGVVYSSFVTTVSPNYADEALYGDGSSGLGRTLKEHQEKFCGVLNGVDYDVWNPETDSFLAARYTAGSIEDKARNTQALRDRFWLRKTHSPVVAYVGRLDEQKGMHLVHHALFYTLAHGGQFVLIGDAHHHDSINTHFWHLKDYLNDNPDCHLEIGYREELAHLIYAGADLLVVPSMFEPCGLAPLIGMRYGTVPVVRATGGMIDTVFDRDNSGHLPAERNGYVFHHTDNQAIESALSRAFRLWSISPREFRKLATNCMRADYSWARPGQNYLEIYEDIRRK